MSEKIPASIHAGPLADHLTSAELHKVARTGEQITVPEGWSLIWEQTPGDAAYVLLEGTVAVLLHGEDIATLGPGDIVGEAALRERRLRTATVSARTPLVALRLTHDDFQRLTEQVPAFRAAVDANVAERLAGR